MRITCTLNYYQNINCDENTITNRTKYLYPICARKYIVALIVYMRYVFVKDN